MKEEVFNFLNQTLKLHPLKGLFWEEQSLLVIGDLHFGKILHFRKSGVGLPEKAIVENLNNLKSIINYFEPKQVLFLGDLFHSKYNKEWEVFCKLIGEFNQVEFTLLIGNHDTLSMEKYNQANLKVVHESLVVSPFIFTHEPVENKTEYYQISGHIHPGIKLSGKGVGSITIPCFYFKKKQAIMPAFGYFTGLHRVKPKKGEVVFGIVSNTVLNFKI